MHKFFGLLFLAAGLVVGLATWQVWREMGDHSTSMVLLPSLAILCFFLLIVGVKFMRGKNPIEEMWRHSLDDE